MSAGYPTGQWPTPGAPIPSEMNDTPTLRDQFAMAALTGLLADPYMRDDCERFAKTAYLIADAMLVARVPK